MPNILINPNSGLIEFTTGAAGGSSFNTNFTGGALAARLSYDNFGGININSYVSGISGLDRFSIDGANGRLFSVTDNLSGPLFSVNDIAGLPIIEAFDDNTVIMGAYNRNDFVLTGNSLGLGGLPNTGTTKLYVSGNMLLSGTLTTNQRPFVNGTGVLLSGEAAQVDLSSTVRTTGNQTISGTKTFATGVNISGNVGIGIDSNNNFHLYVRKSAAGVTVNPDNGSIAVFEGSGNSHITVLASNAQTAGVVLGAPADPFGSYLSWNHDNNELKLATDKAGGFISLLTDDELPAVRITSGGNVGIGTISPSEKLQVVGNILANNLVYNTGNQTISGIKIFGTNNNYSGAHVVIAGGSGNLASGNFVTIGGGSSNRVVGTNSTVGGGLSNCATANYSIIGGGYKNLASGTASTIGGGKYNCALGQYSNIGGGSSNCATGDYSFVGGGVSNCAQGHFSTIGGGLSNTATAAYSNVGGGWLNSATAAYSTVGGGLSNTATANYSNVGGGTSNCALGQYSNIGGGQCNCATGQFSTVGGGLLNCAQGNCSNIGGGSINTSFGESSFIGGGFQNTGYSTGLAIVGGIRNFASGAYSFIGGGLYNRALSSCSIVVGGTRNIASGFLANVVGGYCNIAIGNSTTIGGGICNCAQGNCSNIVGGRTNFTSGNLSIIGGGCDNIAIGTASTIGGGRNNYAVGNSATIGGGFINCTLSNCTTVAGGRFNIASGVLSTIGGGGGNCALAANATVGGGYQNCALGINATIGGGRANCALGIYSTVGGGGYNCSSGVYSIINGGRNNCALGDYSYIIGGRCSTVSVLHSGSAVLGDGQFRAHNSFSEHSLTLDFLNGVYFAGGTVNASTIARINQSGFNLVSGNFTYPVFSNATGFVFTPDASTSTFFDYTLSGNSTLDQPINMNNGQSITIFLTQDATGNRSMSFNTGYLFSNGITPSLNFLPSGTDILQVIRLRNKLYSTFASNY